MSLEGVESEEEILGAINDALEQVRSGVAEANTVLFLRKESRKSSYQAFPPRVKKDLTWLKSQYELASSIKHPNEERAKLKIFLGLKEISETATPTETAAATSTATRRYARTATDDNIGSEDTAEEDNQKGPHTTQKSQNATRCPDKTPQSVELEPGKKIKELLHDLKPAARQPRFPLKEHLHVALELFCLLPNMVDGVVEALRKAEETDDPAVFSQADKTLLQAMTNVLAFNSSEERLQNLTMADFLLSLLFLNGKVDSVSATLEEILKQLEGMTGECRLPRTILEHFMGQPVAEEEEADNGFSCGFVMPDSGIRRHFLANTLKNSKGKPVAYKRSEDLPNVIFTSVANFKESSVKALPKITINCNTAKKYQQDEADYCLKAIVIEERVICVFPDRNKESMTIISPDAIWEATQEEDVDKVYANIMKAIDSGKLKPSILVYARKESASTSTTLNFEENSLPEDLVSKAREEFSRNSEAIRFHTRDFTPETIRIRYKAMTNIQNIKQQVKETARARGLTMSEQMQEVFSAYITSELTDLMYKPIGLVMLQPPHHMVFSGPPGTGKTTTSSVFSEIMYKCGLVTDPEIVTVRRDLISSKYVNEMEQEMKKILDDAAGRVLLVDEIYQLGSGGNDAKKALEAIMNRAYEPRENTPIIILAGYQDHIEKEVFSLNPGFRSRFHHIVTFAPMEVEQLAEILLLKLQQSYVRCEGCGLAELQEAINHLPKEYLAHNNARVAGQITQNIKVESPTFTPGFRPSLRTGLAVSLADIEQAVMKLKNDVSDGYAPDTEDEGTKRRTRAKKTT